MEGINYFTQPQLIQIYEASSKSTDRNKLLETARELFPDVLEPNGESPVFVLEGSCKSFLTGEEYVKAAYTITSRKLNAIGIMSDGSAIPYDK